MRLAIQYRKKLQKFDSAVRKTHIFGLWTLAVCIPSVGVLVVTNFVYSYTDWFLLVMAAFSTACLGFVLFQTFQMEAEKGVSGTEHENQKESGE